MIHAVVSAEVLQLMDVEHYCGWVCDSKYVEHNKICVTRKQAKFFKIDQVSWQVALRSSA